MCVCACVCVCMSTLHTVHIHESSGIGMGPMERNGMEPVLTQCNICSLSDREWFWINQ